MLCYEEFVYLWKSSRLDKDESIRQCRKNDKCVSVARNRKIHKRSYSRMHGMEICGNQWLCKSAFYGAHKDATCLSVAITRQLDSDIQLSHYTMKQCYVSNQ